MKKVLVLGSGGREHAIACQFTLSKKVSKVLVSPGNDGMLITPKIEIDKREDFISLANEYKPDLIFIGPEKYLVSGLANRLRQKGFSVVGPNKEASRLEGSKAYMKSFLMKHDIPCGKSFEASNIDEAKKHLEFFNDKKIVIKTDELASGKGVFICENQVEANSRLEDLFLNNKFPIKTKKIILEEYLDGVEVSSFYYIKNNKIKYFGTACDHKRLLDNDLGPNTGGMGCYLTSKNQLTKAYKEQIDSIAKKTMNACLQENTPYEGILFIGLMIVGEEVKVLEYNVRFGDPEAQTIIPAIKNDFWEVFEKFDEKIEFYPASVHVVATSKNYSNLESAPLILNEEIHIPEYIMDGNEFNRLYFAGTKKEKDNFINSGGRVFGITCFGENHDECVSEAYKLMSKISFNGMYYRKDIGSKYV